MQLFNSKTIHRHIARAEKPDPAKREAMRVEPPARADLKAMIEAATDDE